MEKTSNLKKINIAFFSGTGCTKMSAELLADFLKKNALTVNVEEICRKNLPENKEYDLFILMFPVHAFNAPRPVVRWIKNIRPGKKSSAAVISVSGGGEVFPNRACRLTAIRELSKKGYDVTYQKMLVMPSNCITVTPDEILYKLIKIMPEKISKIAQDITEGKILSASPSAIDKAASSIAGFGQMFFGYIGKIKISEKCSKCGWCSDNCPTENIAFTHGKAIINNRCCLCLKCLYGCPEKAVKLKFLNFLIFKEGFDINNMRKKAFVPVKSKTGQPSVGYVWKGAVKYLSDV